MSTSFEELATGAADLTVTDALEIVQDVFGIDATSATLADGEVDRNALIDDRFVLKVAGSNALRSELELQNAVLRHLEHHDVGVELPRVVAATTGDDIVEVSLPDGRHMARLLTFVPGRPMRELRFKGAELLRDLGRTAGRLVVALDGFAHPAGERTHFWDVARVKESVTECLPFVTADQRLVVETILSWIDDAALRSVPVAFLHQDLNDDNVLVASDPHGTHRISGIIDVGDVLRTVRIGEVAVAVAYAMRGTDDPLDVAASVVAGYHEVCPLDPDEATLVFALAAARLCTNVTTWTRRVALDPQDAYAVQRMSGSWEILSRLAALDPLWAAARMRAVCGFEPHPSSGVTGGVRFAAAVAVPAATSIDLGPDGDIYDIADPDDPVAVRAVIREPAVARYLGVDLTKTEATVQTGIRIFSPGTVVAAPLAGTVERIDRGEGWIVLRHAPGFFSCFGGLELRDVGNAVDASAELGVAGPDLLVMLALSLPPEGRPPAFVRPAERDAARSAYPDPGALVAGSIDATAAGARVDEILAIRERRFASSQRSYYRRPMNLVRGRGVWFFDEDGKRYLDAVNNVTHVGHAHPRIVEAAVRQMRRLNTNSRFVYSQLADYAERLVSKLPAPLEVVFFACTGSEANDLALRIARTATGRESIVTIDGAYHGNTTAVTAVSPNRYKSIGEQAPPMTCEVPQPNRYRGAYGYDDPDAGAKYAAEAGECIRRFVDAGNAPAALISESLMGTAGEIVHPPGYLGSLFDRVRAAGGLCISDEVQVGFGRLGSTFWGYAMHDVVPDIVTLGKPIANGFPMSAVVTTRAIADAFDNGMRYFNTFGGNPVACAVGMAVLDVIEDEGLQAHAGVVGPYLRDRLAALGDKHALIGDVRGEGLYVGVELVRDRTSKEPAREEAFLVSERMKDEGVIVYPNGLDDNILKLKPPMVFDRDHADLFADTLDEVLTTGW